MIKCKNYNKKRYQIGGKTQLNKPFIEGYSEEPIKLNTNYNNYIKPDNTNYNNYQPVNKVNKTVTTPVSFAGKPTINIPVENLNEGTITKSQPRTLYNTYFNTPANSHGTGIVPFANNLINAGDIVGLGEGLHQGIKYGVNKLAKRPTNLIDNGVINATNHIENLSNRPVQRITSPQRQRYYNNNNSKRLNVNTTNIAGSNKTFSSVPQGLPDPTVIPGEDYADSYLYPTFFRPFKESKLGGKPNPAYFMDTSDKSHIPNRFINVNNKNVIYKKVPKRPKFLLEEGNFADRYLPKKPKQKIYDDDIRYKNNMTNRPNGVDPDKLGLKKFKPKDRKEIFK